MPLYKIIFTLILSISLTACVNKDPLFGNGLVPPNQQMVTAIDSNLKVKTYNITIDSMVSSNISSSMLMGNYTDPISGAVDAAIVSNFLPKGFLDDTYFGKDAKIDSMKVLFTLKYAKGDTTQKSRFEIYDFNGFVFKSYKKYFSNFDVTPYISQKPLFTKEIPGAGGAITGFLPMEYAERFLDNVPGEKNMYNNDTLMHAKLNGLVFRVVPPAGSKGTFYTMSLGTDVARMFVYYSNATLPDSALIEHIFFTSPDVNIASKNTAVALYKNDYTKADPAQGGIDYRTINDTVNQQPKCYVSGPVGLAGYVELDTESFDKLKADAKAKGFSTIALHKALLQWEKTDKTWQNYDISYQALGLYYNFEGPSFIPDYNYLQEQQNSALATTLGGVLNRSVGIYSQDITRYVQSYLAGLNKKIKVQLAPVIPDRFIYSNTVVWGSNAPNPENKPKLILTYTLLK